MKMDSYLLWVLVVLVGFGVYIDYCRWKQGK